MSDLDNSCRDHDTRYALAQSKEDLTKADELFYNEQFGKGLRPSLYSFLVLYFNRLTRSISGDFKPVILKTESIKRLGAPVDTKKVEYCPTDDGATISTKASTTEKPINKASASTLALLNKSAEVKDADTKKETKAAIPEVSKVIDRLTPQPELISSNNPQFRAYLSKHYKRIRRIKNRNSVYISH